MSKKFYIIGGVAIFISFMTWVFWPSQVMMEVQAVEWVHTYRIQVLKTIRHNDASSVPLNGRKTNSRVKMWTTSDEQGYTRIHFKTLYDYDIEEFVHSRNVSAFGNYPSEPFWPEVKLSPSTGFRGTGQERIGGQVPTYTVIMVCSEGVFTKELDYNEWKKFSPKQQVYVTKFRFGTVSKIRLLEDENESY